MSDTSTMEGDLPVEYYTEAGRLESFQVAHQLPKRRDSSTKGRGAKPAKWPHSWLEPKSLAEAGFIYMPEPGNLDNVMCFLCRRSICGWTNGDEPLSEHLKLSPDCGWAITSCIEAKVGDIYLENPMSTRMVEARKATFGDRWPHDSKKGWKCKTKQLVEAGWIYKPTYDGDDFAECIYCTLALDGWEPADKPFHEHHARSPDCAFFELCNRPESPITKKTTTKRKPRASAVRSSSRLSMQSTLEPEPSYVEEQTFATANETLQDEGDSTATTSSIMPKGKGKKATVARSRKKKAESVTPDSDHEVNASSDQETVAPPPKSTKKGRGKKVKEEAPAPPAHNHSIQSAVSESLIVETVAPKSRRGKKRVSDSDADESVIAPASKRRTRNSVAMQESVMPESSMNNTNDEITASTPPKRATSTKKRAARFSRSRISSGASEPSIPDEHLDQQLEAELDRQRKDMDVENPSRTVSPEMLNPKPAMAPLGRKLRNSGGRQLETSHHDMFNQMDVDEDEVDREMERMAEEEISKPLPKSAKGKKGAAERKVSVKQQVKEEKARRKAAEEQAKREQAQRKAEELRFKQEREAEDLRIQQEEKEAEELRLQQEAEEAEKLRLQQEAEEAEELRLQQLGEEKRRAAAKAKADEKERQYQAQMKAEQDRFAAEERQAAEEAEARRLELEAEAEERRLELEAEEEEERRLADEEGQRIRIEQEEEEECRRLDAEKSAIQEKLRKKNEAAAAAKASKARGKGKAKVKPKSPSPGPEPSPARSPTPQPSSERSPTPTQHSTPAQPLSAVSARSGNRSAISTRSQRTVRTLSPSASPQSSDAENHPPSSRPSSSIQPSSAATGGQVLGATTPKTPSRSRNATGDGTKLGLVSTEPWQEVDLDTIFAYMRSPDKENQDTVMVGGDLTEEEGSMTVEEWIRYNAVKAEARLKRECESLVAMFEREGMRAVRVLEGVETIDG